MKSTTYTEHSRNIKKQVIHTVRVFTEDDQVYIKKGKYQRSQVPLRWIPVIITE